MKAQRHEPNYPGSQSKSTEPKWARKPPVSISMTLCFGDTVYSVGQVSH